MLCLSLKCVCKNCHKDISNLNGQSIIELTSCWLLLGKHVCNSEKKCTMEFILHWRATKGLQLSNNSNSIFDDLFHFEVPCKLQCPPQTLSVRNHSFFLEVMEVNLIMYFGYLCGICFFHQEATSNVTPGFNWTSDIVSSRGIGCSEAYPAAQVRLPNLTPVNLSWSDLRIWSSALPPWGRQSFRGD